MTVNFPLQCNDSHCIAGCAKCVELEEQLKTKSEEIKKLKEGMSLNEFIANDLENLFTMLTSFSNISA